MTTLVVGASGATGRLLVEQLLGRGQQIRVIVRVSPGEASPTPENLPPFFHNNDNVSIRLNRKLGKLVE